MATINYNETILKVYHFYGKDMVEGLYYRKADADKLIESLKAGHNIGQPDTPKPRRATNRELARWLAQGNGEVLCSDRRMMHSFWEYDVVTSGLSVCDDVKVRKWSDSELHEPTVDYLFGGDE